MASDDIATRDVLWKMYQEHLVQGRHHETQRSTVIGLILAISTAVVAIITFDKSIMSPLDVPLSIILFLLGLFGAGFSLKHYERYSLHMERARQCRDELDMLLPGQPLMRIKIKADERHEKKFPLMHSWRLYYWWVVLNIVVALLGLSLTVIAIWFPIISS